MPRVPNDFTKEVIFYMIKCNDLELTDVYVGATFNFDNRKSQHKQSSLTNPFKIYQYIRDNGGWSNFNMNCIDRRVCKDMLEVRQHEQSLIDNYNATLNTIKAFRKETRQEADHLTYVKHAEKYKQKHREYRAKNKDKCAEHGRQYRMKNAEKVKAYNEEYRLKNLTKLREYDAQRRQKKREQLIKSDSLGSSLPNL